MADGQERGPLLPPWSRSDRPVPRAIVRPIQQFMHREASGGIVLAVAAVVALVWANLDVSSYERLWGLHLRASLGGWSFDESLRHVVNDLLMALFFFVIGLEIKREFAVGELRDRRAALLPLVAALGGMAVPAILYVIVTRGGSGVDGWGVPMATDIAFALGVLALLGDRVPLALKVLLLAIAVIDDIGAIVVIALFYSDGLRLEWIGLGLIVLGAIEVSKRLYLRWLPLYVSLGALAWVCAFESGIHATIAGVAVGLLTPARPFQDSDAVSGAARRIADETRGDHADPDEDAEHWRRLAWLSGQAISPLAVAQHALHPWTSYVVLPLFALANVGVVVDADAFEGALSSPVGLGIMLGLVVGKPVGILLGCAIAVRLGIGRLPDETGWLHIAGIGALAGIGFTVSLFITTLAFPDGAVASAATFAVLIASFVAGMIGAALLVLAHRRREARVRSGDPASVAG